MEYIHSRAPEGSAVLFHGDSRIFYSKRRAFASSPDQRPVLEAWAQAAPDPEALLERFRAEGVSCVLINQGELSRLSQETRLDAAGRARLAEFWRRHARKEFEIIEPPKRWVEVYRIE